VGECGKDGKSANTKKSLSYIMQQVKEIQEGHRREGKVSFNLVRNLIIIPYSNISVSNNNTKYIFVTMNSLKCHWILSFCIS
jgi:hypothetical protein